MGSDREATPWLYRARLEPEGVVDGDTIDVTVDLGFRLTRTIRLRLTDVDTAEIYGVERDSREYARGITHKNFVEGWLTEADRRVDGEWPLLVNTHEDSTGKFGRYTAEVIRQTERGAWAFDATLNDTLLEKFGDEVRSL